MYGGSSFPTHLLVRYVPDLCCSRMVFFAPSDSIFRQAMFLRETEWLRQIVVEEEDDCTYALQPTMR